MPYYALYMRHDVRESFDLLFCLSLSVTLLMPSLSLQMFLLSLIEKCLGFRLYCDVDTEKIVWRKGIHLHAFIYLSLSFI
jgi:hypothetical protein